jgi:hypothetical protein
MTNHLIKRLALVMVIALLAAPALGAEVSRIDNYVDILKSDIKAQKEALMKKALQLTDKEYAAFMPIYREYQTELAAWRDKKAALTKEYMKSMETMTKAQAKQLSQKAIALDEEKTRLKKKYYAKIEKALSSIPAIRFFQTEGALANLEELQDSASLPVAGEHYGSYPGGNPPPLWDAK